MATKLSKASKPDKADKYVWFLLKPEEEWWRAQYELLLKHGYQLRPRFRPGWTPSWTVKKKYPELSEDGHSNRHPKTIDARRLSDDKRVMIKRLVKGSKEAEIARFFSSEELRKDPRNHCVPILDVFSEEHDRLEFMVMPLLITFWKPRFASVDEVLDFMEQMLEGLSFMHEHGVAHRDCSDLNILMDGDILYPKGFHPGMIILDASGERLAWPRRRRNVAHVTYYFTDFGISTHFDGTEKTRLVTGEDGQDDSVPELHQLEPYDPFAVDVFILGNVFRRWFVRTYENLAFLLPLVEEMISRNPKDRPASEEALRKFRESTQHQPLRSLRWALITRRGTKSQRFMRNTGSVVHEAVVFVKSFFRACAENTALSLPDKPFSYSA